MPTDILSVPLIFAEVCVRYLIPLYLLCQNFEFSKFLTVLLAPLSFLKIWKVEVYRLVEKGIFLQMYEGTPMCISRYCLIHYAQMDQCLGEIGDLKRNQQQLLDRDGSSKLINRIEAVETLLNTELTRIRGDVKSDCVDPLLLQKLEVKMEETDCMINDDLDKIKERVEKDFGSLNALQEMLHLLAMRQV